MQIICPDCGWIGNPNQLPREGEYPARLKYECPQCGNGLGVREGAAAGQGHTEDGGERARGVTKRVLPPGIHDNSELRLWYEWQEIAKDYPRWTYHRGQGDQFVGPDESLERQHGAKRLRVLLGGNGLYTPLAELDKPTTGARITTCATSPQTRYLRDALETATMAGQELGKPLPPPRRRGRGVTVHKLPTFDPAWPPDVAAAWWGCFEALREAGRL